MGLVLLLFFGGLPIALVTPELGLEILHPAAESPTEVGDMQRGPTIRSMTSKMRRSSKTPIVISSVGPP